MRRTILGVAFVSTSLFLSGQAPVLLSSSTDQHIGQLQFSSLYVNRLDNVRYASQFASGSSTGGIQEAIWDLPPNGGVVMLPAGVTSVTDQIKINKSVILRGQGFGGIANGSFNSWNTVPDTQWSTPSVIQSQLTNGADVILVQPLAIGVQTPTSQNNPPATGYLGGVVLEDFQVQGNLNGGGCGIALVGGSGDSKNPTNSYWPISGLVQLQQIVIDRVTSRDNPDCGIKIQDGAFMITIRDSQVIKNLDGIRCTSSPGHDATAMGTSQLWLYGVIADLNGRDGVRIEGRAGDISIYGGTFSDSQDTGLGVFPGNGVPGGTVNVYGAHFEGNLNAGISLGAGSGHVIDGNTIERNASVGISIWTKNSGRAAILLGNQLQNNGVDIVIGSGDANNPTRNVVIGPQATTNYTYMNSGSAAGTVYFLYGNFPSGTCLSNCVSP